MAEYIVPMPYAHRHDVRATKKPNAKGETNGEMVAPMAQMLSYWWGSSTSPVMIDDKNDYLPSSEVEWIHIRKNKESLKRWSELWHIILESLIHTDAGGAALVQK